MPKQLHRLAVPLLATLALASTAWFGASAQPLLAVTGTPLYVPLMLGEPTATPTQTATASPTATSTPTSFPTSTPTQTPTVPPSNCSPAYPTVCIPPPPPDLDCGDIPYRQFQVLPPDPHNFDGDHDGVGCES